MKRMLTLCTFLAAFPLYSSAQTNGRCLDDSSCKGTPSTRPSDSNPGFSRLFDSRDQFMVRGGSGPIRTVYVDTRNLARWLGNDPGAWINSAMASLPRIDGYPSGIVNLDGLAGSSPAQTTEVVVSSPYVSVIGPGKSELVITCHVDGPCWDTRISPFTIAPAGRISGFTLMGEGTRNPNAVAIESGDRIGGEFCDIAVDNFLGTGSSGLWINNSRGFFERNLFVDIELGIHGKGVQDGNTKNIRITNSGQIENNSVEYNTFLSIRMTVLDAQIGWSIEGRSPNPPFLRGNNWEGSSNMYPGGTLFSFSGTFSSPTTLMQDSNIQWTSECTGCSANSTRFRLSPNVIVSYSGQVSGGTFSVDSASDGELENLFNNDPTATAGRVYSDARIFTSSNVVPGGIVLNNQSNTVNGLGANVSLTAFNAKGIWGTEYMSTQVANQYWCLTNGSAACAEQMRLTPAGLQTQGHLNQYAANSNWGVCTFKSSTKCMIKYDKAFVAPPTVLLTPVNPGTITVTLASTSNTGFTIRTSRAASISVNWIALGNPN